MAADDTNHTRLSINATDLSDDSRCIGDHAIVYASQYKPDLLANVANPHHTDRGSSSDRGRLPLIQSAVNASP
jgi:hypothetical protein